MSDGFHCGGHTGDIKTPSDRYPGASLLKETEKVSGKSNTVCMTSGIRRGYNGTDAPLLVWSPTKYCSFYCHRTSYL